MKTWLLLLFGVGILLSFSFKQKQNEAENYRLAFVGLQVSKIGPPTDWYASNFGMTVDQKIDDPQNGYKVAILKNKNMTLELVELRQNASLSPGSPVTFGFLKVGFEVDNVDNLLSRLSKNKIDVFGNVHTDPKTKKRNFLIKDPEGNLIQFFER